MLVSWCMWGFAESVYVATHNELAQWLTGGLGGGQVRVCWTRGCGGAGGTWSMTGLVSLGSVSLLSEIVFSAQLGASEPGASTLRRATAPATRPSSSRTSEGFNPVRSNSPRQPIHRHSRAGGNRSWFRWRDAASGAKSGAEGGGVESGGFGHVAGSDSRLRGNDGNKRRQLLSPRSPFPVPRSLPQKQPWTPPAADSLHLTLRCPHPNPSPACGRGALS